MTDRASHRAAVEAGYADLAGYVEKYGSEPEYPGASIRTARLVWPSTGELGDVRLMDYGSDSKTRYRVACFCPGREVFLPGDTPKIEPEADNWCETLDGANAWFALYVSREHRDGWKDVPVPQTPPVKFAWPNIREPRSPKDRRPPTALNPFDTMMIMQTARGIVSQPTPHYSYVDMGDALVGYLRGEQDVRSTMRTLNALAVDYALARKRKGT